MHKTSGLEKIDVNIKNKFLLWVWGEKSLIKMRLDNNVLVNKDEVNKDKFDTNKIDKSKAKSHIIIGFVILALQFVSYLGLDSLNLVLINVCFVL